MMRTLILCVGCVMFCVACSHRIPPAELNQDQVFSPLDTVTAGLVYDVQIRVQKKQFSGLMFLRQIKSDVWRIAVTAKIGQTILDVELNPKDMILKRSVPQLERKFILTHLERDLRLLTGSLQDVQQREFLDREQLHLIERFSGLKGYWHRLSQPDGLIAENAWGGRKRRKSRVVYSAYGDGIPGAIAIDHRTIVNFEIRMHRVPEKGTH